MARCARSHLIHHIMGLVSLTTRTTNILTSLLITTTHSARPTTHSARNGRRAKKGKSAEGKIHPNFGSLRSLTPYTSYNGTRLSHNEDNKIFNLAVLTTATHSARPTTHSARNGRRAKKGKVQPFHAPRSPTQKSALAPKKRPSILLARCARQLMSKQDSLC